MQRVRVRTSFDSELELPKLQQWFAKNPHPSKHEIQEYVNVLNAQESRINRR
jgi:homeobox domain-containing protein